MKKLTWIHINVIGAVFCLVLAVSLYFALIKPKKDETEKTRTETASIESSGGTQVAVSGKQTELKRTKETNQKNEAAWQVNARRYMPQLNFAKDVDTIYAYYNATYIGPNGTRYGLIDMPRIWGEWVTQWYDAQRNMGINRLGTVFPIPAFPTDPNSLADMQQFAFPEAGKPWQVMVRARSFDDAMAHLERFNTMGGHGMPVVNNVRLQGQSPDLMMSYDLAMYVIPGSAPPPRDGRVGGVAAGGAGGSGMMPGGGRMPGMPPGMSGGPMGGGGSFGGGGGGGSVGKADDEDR
jgi:hypothetical protein